VTCSAERNCGSAAVRGMTLKKPEAEMKVELEALRMKLQTELIDSLDPMQRARMKSRFGELVTLED
jgi:hypothetical protein